MGSFVDTQKVFFFTTFLFERKIFNLFWLRAEGKIIKKKYRAYMNAVSSANRNKVLSDIAFQTVQRKMFLFSSVVMVLVRFEGFLWFPVMITCVSQFSFYFPLLYLITPASTEARYFSLAFTPVNSGYWKYKKHLKTLTLVSDTTHIYEGVCSDHMGGKTPWDVLRPSQGASHCIYFKWSGSSLICWLFMNRKQRLDSPAWRGNATTGTFLKLMLLCVIYRGKSWTITWCDATNQPVTDDTRCKPVWW